MPLPRQAVCGTEVDFAPVDATVLLTPDDFDIPHRKCFTPSELARYLMTDAKTIIRLIEDGQLRALPLRCARARGGRRRVSYKIPWIEIVHFFLRQQGAMN